jgi:hypothetical protein
LRQLFLADALHPEAYSRCGRLRQRLIERSLCLIISGKISSKPYRENHNISLAGQVDHPVMATNMDFSTVMQHAVTRFAKLMRSSWHFQFALSTTNWLLEVLQLG